MSTVVGLVSQFIGGFIVVGRANEPDILRNQNLAPLMKLGWSIW